MTLSDLQRLEQLDHLNAYTEESLILRLGLYDSVLIDTSKIEMTIEQGTEDTRKVLKDEVSPDVKETPHIVQAGRKVV